MSVVYPNLGILNKSIVNTLNSRPKDLINTSKLIAWMRISSAVKGGLILESIPSSTSFNSIYGNSTQSGRVGIDFSGKDVTVGGRGLRPSPIVESITIENGNSGLSRKGKFSIKCYTLAQAEKISQHFLEPGYTVLVEYGWNTKDAIGQKEKLSASYMASFNNYTVINNKRTNSGGTYDGFMGFITGGGYSSGDDETYIIDVDLTTIGEFPTYLQIQKVSIDANSSDNQREIETSGRYTINDIEQGLKSGKNIGTYLFQLVYNRLPNEKKTIQVKSLLNKSETDIVGNPWSSEYNFINVDESTRNKFSENLTTFKARETLTSNDGGSSLTSNRTVKVPDGINWLSDQSFIRMELAFKILNFYGINTKPAIVDSNSNGTPSYSYEISMEKTICRGHKYMFSTDITKLFIPNENHPDFALPKLLTATESTGVSELIDIKNPTTVNGNQWKTTTRGNVSDYAFPSTRKLTSADYDNIAEVQPIEADPHTWGYLRNLYINLDFFIQVIERSNFVAKDCYYEILNGISSACNSIWKFEIAEKVVNVDIGSDTYSVNQMSVVDQTFSGKITDVTGEQTDKYPMFQPNGVYSPFLTSNIIMDIPAVMKNSILGKRSSAKQETSINEKGVYLPRFFATDQDPVMDILDSFKKPTGDVVLDSQGETFNKPSQSEIKKENIAHFAEKGQLLILVRNPTQINETQFFGLFGGEQGSLNGDNPNVIVGAYDDDVLLKKLERGFESTLDNPNGNNPMILSIEFNCDILGISGIKIGDCFKVDRLPNNYSSGIFQVMETSHTLSDGVWTTSVTAKLRNV